MSAKVGVDATKPAKFEGKRNRLPAQSIAWARDFIARQVR
jgi:hypothetical protein